MLKKNKKNIHPAWIIAVVIIALILIVKLYPVRRNIQYGDVDKGQCGELGQVCCPINPNTPQAPNAKGKVDYYCLKGTELTCTKDLICRTPGIGQWRRKFFKHPAGKW